MPTLTWISRSGGETCLEDKRGSVFISIKTNKGIDNAECGFTWSFEDKSGWAPSLGEAKSKSLFRYREKLLHLILDMEQAEDEPRR